MKSLMKFWEPHTRAQGQQLALSTSCCIQASSPLGTRCCRTSCGCSTPGGPLELTIGGHGDKPEAGEKLILGLDIAAGQSPQALIPAGAWQTARPLSDEPVFVTCIVAPAFHYDDFTLVAPEDSE